MSEELIIFLNYIIKSPKLQHLEVLIINTVYDEFIWTQYLFTLLKKQSFKFLECIHNKQLINILKIGKTALDNWFDISNKIIFISNLNIYKKFIQNLIDVQLINTNWLNNYLIYKKLKNSIVLQQIHIITGDSDSDFDSDSD